MEITAYLVPSKKESKVLTNGGMQLSVSKAKTFEDCKARYKYCYIEKLPRKEWDFHIFGKFSHEVLENFHQKLIDEPEQNLRSLMTECFKISLKNYDGKMSKDHKDEAWNILNDYLIRLENSFLPNVLEVEKHFYIDIGHSVLLNGFIDRVQRDDDGILHVADYKTTKKKIYLNDFFQLLTYAFALMLNDSSMEKIRASYILLRHDFEFMTKEFNRAEVMKVAEKFLNYASKINEEKLWAPSPSFLCKYCDYLNRCKDGTDYLVKRKIIKVSGYGLCEW